LLVNQNAVSPRLAVSRYFPSVGVNVHFSYDRIFQTPSFENILLASSPAAEAIDTSVPALQLPVQPSHGNYYEWGATKAFFGKLRLDTNMFRRAVNNYADDSNSEYRDQFSPSHLTTPFSTARRPSSKFCNGAVLRLR
jgi:hypothetical protein